MYCFDFSALVVTGYLPSYFAKNLRLPMEKKKRSKKKIHLIKNQGSKDFEPAFFSWCHFSQIECSEFFVDHD